KETINYFPPAFPVATYEQQPYPSGFQYPAHPGAFSVPPTVVLTRAPLQDPVNNYMCYSIFTTIFCCLPFGIAALIHSNAVSLLWYLTTVLNHIVILVFAILTFEIHYPGTFQISPTEIHFIKPEL
uniref:Si:ch73-343g19.4 n=1 Tax=Oryzias sinensis TaxID=183150 RepID=A0A8C7Z6W5_9TELE